MHDPGLIGYSFPRVFSNFMFDPSVYRGPEAYKDLSKAIQMACKNSGFKTSRGSSSRATQKGNILAFLHIICEHGRESVTALRQQNKSLKYKTSRPMTDVERCPFVLKVFCANHDGCWYLQPTYENHSESCVHKGHVQLMPEDVHTPLNQLDEDALELALQMHELQLDDSLKAKLINIRSEGSTKFTPAQIRYAIARAQAEKICNDFDHKQSSAEKLLASFDKMKQDNHDIEFVALIHDAKLGKFLLKMPKGRPSKDVQNPDEKMDITKIRESMGINDNQQVLLAFAWVTGDELRMVCKFPELFFMDVTEKTNLEKRGMFIATGMDGFGKIFVGLHCFMPNAQACSFNWIYKHALLELWKKEVVERVQVAVTDGENALYSPLLNESRKESSLWRNLEVYR